MAGKLVYQNVLLKVSGEALMGSDQFGINQDTTRRICNDIKEAIDIGAKVALVVGGGNIFRGVALAGKGIDRVPADHMGMMATIMNALVLKGELANLGVKSAVLSAIDIPAVCETFSQKLAEEYRDRGFTIIFAGGTGNPFFTTDTAAALRASEMGCDALLKATQVDGIYSEDPEKNPDAERFDTISYTRVLQMGLEVMDAAAISLARQAEIPVVVFSIAENGGLAQILKGGGRSTTVTAE